MKLSLFNYNLPKHLIAQKPAKPRDSSRLLVLGTIKSHKSTTSHKISHHKFYEIEKFLNPGDVLVLNNSKVIPARLYGHREGTGGKLEIFLLRQVNPNTWECLVGGKRARVGLALEFSKTLSGKLIRKMDDGKWKIEFNKKSQTLKKEIHKIGNVPLPPYIKKGPSSILYHPSSDYQTIFAKHEGSVAAPTAGLHFTKCLLNRLKKKGIQIEFVTLHVGLGTFAPVKTQKIENHKMHPEFAILNSATCKRLNQAKAEGRRIIAVGTTSVRVLESVADKQGRLKLIAKDINTFIYPGYKFKFTDGLITNFHLPKSTLLMLVSALTSRPLILKAYQEAIKKKYRFYSFGDAMFIC